MKYRPHRTHRKPKPTDRFTSWEPLPDAELVSNGTVPKVTNQPGTPTPDHKRTLSEIAQPTAEGMPQREIAVEVGCDHKTVGNRISGEKRTLSEIPQPTPQAEPPMQAEPEQGAQATGSRLGNDPRIVSNANNLPTGYRVGDAHPQAPGEQAAEPQA